MNGGINLYDLAPPACPECGRPVTWRLLPFLAETTGCETCDAVIFAHRCTARPNLSALAPGESWTCRECWSVWTAAEEDYACGECGQPARRLAWSFTPGARLDEAPRFKGYIPVPFRNVLPSPGKCHRTPGGIMVHVKPGCRCR